MPLVFPCVLLLPCVSVNSTVTEQELKENCLRLLLLSFIDDLFS